jgi:hypothetical protein
MLFCYSLFFFSKIEKDILGQSLTKGSNREILRIQEQNKKKQKRVRIMQLDVKKDKKVKKE